MGHFWASETSRLEEWPRKTIGCLFCAHHFLAVCVFPRKLQSGNVQFGSKSSNFVACVTLKFTRWPWKQKGVSSVPFMLCALFRRHLWIENIGTVQKRPMRVKIVDILARVALKFNGWHWKATMHIFHNTSICVHNFVAICRFKLELGSTNAWIGEKMTSVTFTFCMNITSVNGNNSWKFHDDAMRGK